MKTNFKKMFAVTIALSVLSFGFTARSVDSTDIQSKENVRLATALTGCVIVEEDEMGIIYRKKCEKCGHVQPGSVMSGRIPKGFRVVKQFKCLKCGAQNRMEIQG